MSYIVDQQSGPYYTIQSAIDKAKSGSIIKINTGLYKENLVIKGKSLSLEARDINSEVYILGSKGPTILIEDAPPQSRMMTKTSGNRLETYASGSDSESNMNKKSTQDLYSKNMDKDEVVINKNFLHSKTEIDRPNISSSNMSKINEQLANTHTVNI
jgi:pectin methylesterase-like acyl-CoA thioesterase